MSALDPDDVRPEFFHLRLFVSGTTPRSTRAIETMRRLCETYLQGRHTLEVIDIYQNPQAARDDQIIAVPTLVKRLPAPLRKYIGDLSDNERLLRGLEISLAPPPASPDN